MRALSTTAGPPWASVTALPRLLCDRVHAAVDLPRSRMTANQFDKKTEAWSALFSEPISELVQRYTASVSFDKRLWRADIAGSIAHADMLAAQGFIAAADLGAIRSGLTTIAAEIESGA